jgi:hypothetical protein
MLLMRSGSLLLLLLLTAQPALAQQTLNFTFGYFSVRGEDARVEGDVINENLNFFAFEVDDFSGGAAGVEWLIPLGQYIEAGAGVSFSRRTVPSVYRSLTEDNGAEIEQEFRLRMVPVALTMRVLPLGQSSGVQPYLGAGLGLISWRYSESGDFVDFSDDTIFHEQFVASGTERGPLVFGGIRFAGASVSGGFEVRYQSAEAELGTRFATGLPDPQIDLGGWTYQGTVGYRFGR